MHIERDDSLVKNNNQYISDFDLTIDALVPDLVSLSAESRVLAFGSADTVATTATGDNNIDGLLGGIQWADFNVSFSFPDSFSNDYEADYQNAAAHAASFQMFNANQQRASRDWIEAASGFGNVSLLNPVELTGINDRDASIRMAVSNHPPHCLCILSWFS